MTSFYVIISLFYQNINHKPLRSYHKFCRVSSCASLGLLMLFFRYKPFNNFYIAKIQSICSMSI